MNNLTIKNNEKDFMFVKCSDSTYLIDTNNIVEIIKMPRLEYPQRLPKYISGLLDYRGDIINTADLRSILGFELKHYDKNTNIAILEDKNEGKILALAFDEVEKIDKVDLNFVKSAPLNNADSFARGIYTNEESSFIILDINKIIRRVFEGIENNETSEMPNLLPYYDLEIYNKRSLECRSQKNTIENFAITNNYQYCVFSINDTNYCLNNKLVKSFYKLDLEQITKIPLSKEFVMGILNVRGEFITIIDLNCFFGRESAKVSSKSTIIIPDSKEFKIGFIADKIGGSINIENMGDFSQNEESYVLNDEIYYVLNLQSILNDEKLYLK